MPFNHEKYINDQDLISSKVASLEQSRPALPKEDIGNIRMEVVLTSMGDSGKYPIIEMKDIAAPDKKLIIGQDNYLDVTNFIKQIFS